MHNLPNDSTVATNGPFVSSMNGIHAQPNRNKYGTHIVQVSKNKAVEIDIVIMHTNIEYAYIESIGYTENSRLALKHTARTEKESPT